MRCDYIRATFWGDKTFQDGRELDLCTFRMQQISSIIGGTWEHQKRGLNGYGIRFNLERDGEVVCMALTDGSGDAAGSHQIESQGHFSPEVKSALDQVLGKYNTARRDTCFDILDEPGYPLFEQMADVGRQMAREKRMKYDQIGQGWLVPGETRTIYLGSRNSPVMIRIYTRGLKTLAEGGIDDPLRIRVEVEVKPGKAHQKAHLTTLSDEQLFGCAGWAKEFMDRLGVLGIERQKIGTVWKLSDKQKVFAHLVKQYGVLILDIIDRSGAHGFESMVRNQVRCDQQIRDTLRNIEVLQEVESW